jgi:excinuclease ABC subunit C
MRKEGRDIESSLLADAENIPAGPGVYVMRDERGRVLYVGKAKSLRSRLRSYREKARLEAKTRLLLYEAVDLETIVTDTELEALILENSLIKEYRPKYNITLRDDKTYPFLRLSLQDEFPMLSVVRRPADDGARYFGPFVPAGAMRKTLKILQRVFPLRKCSGPLKKVKKRGCLNFQMHRCLGPCTNEVSPAEYRELVDGVALFLAGGGARLAAAYRRKMKEHARQREYEEAAALRDRVAALESILARQKVHVHARGDRDIVGLAVVGTKSTATVLESRKGRIVNARTMSLVGDVEEEPLSDFLRAYYERATSVPPVVLLPHSPEGKGALTAWLRMKRGGKVALVVPRSGAGRSLVTMACRNALESLQRKRGAWEGALTDLGKETGEGAPLRSLAALDVSSLSGTLATAGLAWWERGKFVKRNYRKFRIRDSAGSDDYASMGEAVARLSRKVGSGEWPNPDILLLDGGAGHLSEVRKVLDGSRWQPKLLLAIAKGEARSWDDRVVSGRSGDILKFSELSSTFRVLQAARDEAHRFAVSYHRSLRRERTRRSAVDAVPGIGPARKKLLLKRFGSMKRLRQAEKKELLAVKGLPASVVEDLYTFLRKDR